MDLHEFFQMGGYAAYVWPAYGLTALVLYINYVLPVKREQRLIQKLARRSTTDTGPPA